jgi:hypothetical protein
MIDLPLASRNLMTPTTDATLIGLANTLEPYPIMRV